MNRKLTVVTFVFITAYVITMTILGYNLPAYMFASGLLLAMYVLYYIATKGNYKPVKTPNLRIVLTLFGFVIATAVRLFIDFGITLLQQEPSNIVIMCSLQVIGALMYLWFSYPTQQSLYLKAESVYLKKSIQTIKDLAEVDSYFIDLGLSNATQVSYTLDGEGNVPEGIIKGLLEKQNTTDYTYSTTTDPSTVSQYIAHDGSIKSYHFAERNDCKAIGYLFSFKTDPDNKILIAVKYIQNKEDFNIKSLVETAERHVVFFSEHKLSTAIVEAKPYTGDVTLTELTESNVKSQIPKTRAKFAIAARTLETIDDKTFEEIRDRLVLVYGKMDDTNFPRNALVIQEKSILDNRCTSFEETADIPLSDISYNIVNETIAQADRVYENEKKLRDIDESINKAFLLLTLLSCVVLSSLPFIIPYVAVLGFVKFFLIPISITGKRINGDLGKYTWAVTIVPFLLLITSNQVVFWSASSLTRRSEIVIYFSIMFAVMYLCGFGLKTSIRAYIVFVLVSILPIGIMMTPLADSFQWTLLNWQHMGYTVIMALMCYPLVNILNNIIRRLPIWKNGNRRLSST